MNTLILIYITNPTRAEARRVARYLLQKRLIACANIHPVESLYPWKGKLADEKEFVLIAKTTPKNFEKVRREVERIHSYTIPCVLKISVRANQKYFNWAKGEVK